MIAGINRMWIIPHTSISNKGFRVKDTRLGLSVNSDWIEVDFDRDSAQYKCQHVKSTAGEIFEHSIKFTKQTVLAQDYNSIKNKTAKLWVVAMLINNDVVLISGINIPFRLRLEYLTGQNPLADLKGYSVEMKSLSRDNVEFIDINLIIKKFTPIKFGLLYNLYAITDSREIAPEGWHVPTKNEWLELISNLGGESVAGGKLKTVDLNYWNLPNTDATNEVGFNAKGSGIRDLVSFVDLKELVIYWTSTSGDFFGNNYRFGLYHNWGSIYVPFRSGAPYTGNSLRLIKDDSVFVDKLIDIDGNSYPTIKVGNQVWMAENLKVSKYRNGDSIPEVTNQTDWVNLTTGAMCAYNNDHSNI